MMSLYVFIGAPLMFIIPGLMSMSQPKQAHYKRGWLLFLIGIALFIITTIAVIYELVTGKSSS